MHISENLPQFPTEHALLIVAGTFYADLYVVHNGEVEKVTSFEIERPAYSDKEEHFETRSHGKVLAWGSSYEDTEDHDRKRFFKKFEKEIRELLRGQTYDLIFLFAPDYNAPEALKRIPNKDKEKIVGVFKGNYSSKHPFELLKKIKELEKTKIPEPKSEEAQKIYAKSQQHRNK